MEAEEAYINSPEDRDRASKFLLRVANLYRHCCKEIEKDYDNFILDLIENQPEEELMEVHTVLQCISIGIISFNWWDFW